MCITTEINTAPNKHPKLLPHNNIQKHPKTVHKPSRNNRDNPATTEPPRDTPPPPNPNTPTVPKFAGAPLDEHTTAGRVITPGHKTDTISV